MTEIDAFVSRAHAYAERAGLEPSTVSRKLLGNGVRLAELKQGKSLRLDTFERAKAMLDALERDVKAA